jgi:ribosome maturation protein SDO1
MASLDKAMVASMKIDGETFEIMVDPDAALMYKLGQKKEVNNVLAVEEVFKDAKRGERHKSSSLQKAFGTEDIYLIAEKILKAGNLALTTDQKRKMIKEKRTQIASIIAQEAIDPRTGAPHTLNRIEQTMEKVRLDIDPLVDAQMQVEAVLQAIKIELPIKLAKRKIAIKIGPEYAHKAYGLLKMQGMQKEEWASDGSLMAVVTVPAGLVGEFFERLNKATAATAQTKMIE